MSAVIPVYNRVVYLPRAIDSILAQTFQDFEIIVVDDASTEDVCAAVEAYRDARIRYVRLPKRRGVSAARNAGIEAARGEWVAFLDSDDEWLPEKLERQLACADASPGVATVQSWCLKDKRGVRKPSREPTLARGDGWEGLLHGGRSLTPSAFMIRRDALLAIGGFYPGLPFGEDWDILFRLAKHGYRFAGVEERLVVHYDHGEGRMSHDVFARLAAFYVTDRIWRDEVKTRLGRGGYRRWRRRRFKYVKREHERRVKAIIGSGDRRAALRYVVRVLPSIWALRRQARTALRFALTGRRTQI